MISTLITHRSRAFVADEAKAELFEVRGDVGVLHVDALGEFEHGRGEVQDALDARIHEPVGNFLRRGGGNGQNGDPRIRVTEDFLEIVQRSDRDAAHALADLAMVAIYGGDNLETPASEPGVPQKRMSQLPRTHQNHPPYLLRAEDTPQVVYEVRDDITAPRLTELAEKRQVAPNLRGADPDVFGQLPTGYLLDAGRGQMFQLAKIGAQTSKRSIGHARFSSGNGYNDLRRRKIVMIFYAFFLPETTMFGATGAFGPIGLRCYTGETEGVM